MAKSLSSKYAKSPHKGSQNSFVLGAICYIFSDGERIGYLVLSVTIRKESTEMISTLRDCGVQSVLLTGDNENSANSIAKQLGISEVYAGCLPEDKFVVDSLQILPHIRAFQPFIYIHFDTLYFLLWCDLFQKLSDLQSIIDHDTGGGLFYTDKDGKEKILYHNGYINYTESMKKVLRLAGISDADTVLVTGYSAGGFAAALLSDDVFTNYFPDTANKNVLVDAALLLDEDWHTIATQVWQTPKSISAKLVSDNLTLDCLQALHKKYGDGIHLMFTSSTRDGDLAKVQNYLDTGVMDVDESRGSVYQQILKETISQFQEAGVSLFLWDGVPWYDDPRNLTAHTIISTPAVWLPFEEQSQSVAGWLAEAMNGKPKDYGLELVDKEY